MNKLALIMPTMALSAAWSAPTAAQVIIDAIGSTVGNMAMNGSRLRDLPEGCLEGVSEPTPEQVARFAAGAEPALRAYLALAAAGRDVRRAFTRNRVSRLWSLDGAPSDLAGVRDPWASRIARLEVVGLRLGGARVHGRGLWRAFAADGTELGIYDGLFRSKARGFEVSWLELFSKGAPDQPSELNSFCYTPGDIESARELRAVEEAQNVRQSAE